MVQESLQTSLNAFRSIIAERHEGSLGRLGPIPKYEQLLDTIHDASARSCYRNINETIHKLGRAMQLGQHRRLIDSLSSELDHQSLAAMASISLGNSEICAAFAVYLTTLEQAYHWPREVPVSTPDVLEDHKLVIQMLNQPQLRKILRILLGISTTHEEMQIQPGQIAQTALTLARSILDDVRLMRERDQPVPRDSQDVVNLLYRTCRSDWNDQGYDSTSHKEFGRLHEVIRASGTQRHMQELFEESSGLLCLQIMPTLLENLSITSSLLSHALTQLQFAVAVAREELFSVSVDEVIWGRAFANFSKAVGFSDISAGGGDGPIFWMLDSLCGQTKPKLSASLPEELNFRARFFPENMRDLMGRMRGLPALREFCQSDRAPAELKESFKALERQRFELYNMHRKKAARIGVSLRAGQRGTSAGVSGCAHATPENTLANTLSSAVSARFGDSTDDLSINATAQAHSLMFDDDGSVYSARVRFRFETPLTIGPGDCLLVNVQLSGEGWRTRTYSTTYTHNSHRPLEKDAHQIARTAEVYIRSKGQVSKYLCSQTQGCKVRIAVKPAPHFRLTTNSNDEETTIFVAQGGALGIFVAWLETQTQLVGNYVLIVAARHFSQLGFKKELLDLAHKLKQCLRVVVVLSKPREIDVPFLQSQGVETHCGRINHYLDRYSFNKPRAAYVCGTSSFGLQAANSLSHNQDVSKASNRLESIITSHLPPIRLHVAPEPYVVQNLPMISMTELARHNSPTDLWIAVGKNVYDVTTLSKFHPGGEKILTARAGRQGEDLFESVHGGSVDIQSLLDNMIIGHLVPPSTNHYMWEDRLDRVVEIQNDLTNHTRFENICVGPDEELAKAPPAQVIYASLECFGRDWCVLLGDMGLSKSIQCNLMRSCLAVIKMLDARQAAVYSESFEDVECCRQVLQHTFDKLRAAAGKIHTALDTLKCNIAARLSNNQFLDEQVFEDCTNGVIEALKT